MVSKTLRSEVATPYLPVKPQRREREKNKTKQLTMLRIVSEGGQSPQPSSYVTNLTIVGRGPLTRPRQALTFEVHTPSKNLRAVIKKGEKEIHVIQI